MAQGFLYLVVVMDWVKPRGAGLATVQHTRRRVLCRGARGSARPLRSARDFQYRPEPAPAKAGGSQFTGDDFTGTLKAARGHDQHGRQEPAPAKAGGRCMDNILVERLWRSLKYEEVSLNAYATVGEAKAGIAAWLDSTTRSANTRASAIARRGNFTRRACGYVDDRLCRPTALPPLPERARKAGKCSPSPTYPQAPQLATGILIRVEATHQLSR
jgi:hypothetical protein